MDEAHAVRMGVRGQLVVPPDVCDRAGLAEDRPVVIVETRRGLLVLTREQARDLVREDLSGLDLVGELLAERRREAGGQPPA